MFIERRKLGWLAMLACLAALLAVTIEAPEPQPAGRFRALRGQATEAGARALIKDCPDRRYGVLEQAAFYPWPIGGRKGIERLGFAVAYDPSLEALTAVSDSEQTNILALNAADEYITGRKRAPEARELYRRTLDLYLSGKSSPYTRELRFKTGGETRPWRHTY